MNDADNEAIPPSPSSEEGGVEPVQSKAPEQVSTAVQIASKLEGVGQDDSLSLALKDIFGHGMKGPAAQSRLLTYGVGNLEGSLRRSEEEKRELQQKLDTLKEQYYDKREECSNLKERIKVTMRLKVMQQCLATFGAAMFGFGLKGIGAPPSPWPIGLAILGAVMIVAGWLWTFDSKKKDGQ